MKKLNFYTLIAIIISTQSAFAMGAKRPSAGQVKNPPIETPGADIKIPSPTFQLGPKFSDEDYLDSASLVGNRIDQFMGLSELLKNREQINSDQVDKCFQDNHPHDSFAEQISFYISKLMEDTTAQVGVIGSYYGTSSNDSNYFPVSLMRHKLCNVTSSSLSTTIGSKVPDANTISKINKFVTNANELRTEAIAGNLKSKKELMTMWSTFYSCLAYTESLSSADSNKSKQVAQKYAPANYRRPSGVEFYEDPSQTAESRLNIGMYQFTPSSGNNIQSCLRAWNEIHKNELNCSVNTKGTQADMIAVTGSSVQSFNIFCGVHKMLQTFSIQVNTSKSSATHPSNLVNGKLKPFEDRCVSPHFKAGMAYVHFGPFMNSTGTNLSELFSCVDRNL